MKITMKVDWLSLTGKAAWGDVGAGVASYYAAKIFAQRMFDLITEGDAVVTNEKPPPHYVYSFREKHSGLQFSLSENLKVQGWLLRASGSTLNTPARQKRLLYLAGTHGWNCSRLDFAIDLLDTEYTPEQFWREWRDAHKGNMQKSLTLIEGTNGNTAYLGSRTSEKYIRCYDKGAEQGVAQSWIRLEMEFKAESAARAADAAQYDIANLVEGVRRFVDVVDSPTLSAVWALQPKGAGEGYWPLRVAPPRERWFNTDVLSALRKWAVEDLDGTLEWILRAHDEAVLAAEAERRRQTEKPIL